MLGKQTPFSPSPAAPPSAPTTLFGSFDIRAVGGAPREGSKWITVHLVGEPRWVDPECAAIALDQGQEQALIAAYERHGQGLLGEVSGHFALAILDHTQDRVLLATDRLGIRPLFFAQAEGQIVFGSRADQVAQHPAVAAKLSRQALYDYLYFEVVPGPGAIFDGVTRLLPGEYLWLGEGHLDVKRYWATRYHPPAQVPSEKQLQRRFLEIVRQSIFDAAAEGFRLGPVGAFLSGGTDSSTVAGMLAQASDSPVDTFSIGFDAKGYDETPYARLSSRHFGTRHNEYYVTPQDVIDAVPRIAEFMDQPFGNASIVPAWFCARMAHDQGIACLLAGDGGDELFGGNERYSKQLIFEHYNRLPNSLRRGILEPLLLKAPGTARMPGVKKIRSYVEQARIPLPERLQTYNLLERLGGVQVFSEEWGSRLDASHPLDLMRTAHHEAQAGHVLNRMLAVDMRFTIADSDIPKVNNACDMAGVAVRYPWLDQRLVDFAATLPVDQKVRGTRLRHLFKNSLQEFLPQEVLSKRKHGFGLPFGIWLQEHGGLRDLAGDSLRQLEKRGILRAGFIDRLLGEHSRVHASYYGTFVWILMMLEQWLTAHEVGDDWN